ncbi:metal ABC transporter ATP-binding protein [Thermopetrobacter sp. TC1]|uniref:metal ABC transporter ATP-binding protein n=1 Tax=Thermopetrobacter sp. TC1 TaxID=1495045 RepID=UPI0009E06C8F|nr:metal ABC transporter ATP-binding protein [Thermopetrobacter sp. TC1]
MITTGTIRREEKGGARPAEAHDAKAATTRGEELLRLENVGVRTADGRWLIRHVTFSVHRGELVTIIGPNGGGKTTTVRAALGVITPVEGRRILKPDVVIAYVPQRFHVDPSLPLTVDRLLSLAASSTRRQRRKALESTGVHGCLDKPVQSLSGGELQRVLIARALLRKPDLLILDEPVQGVDFAGEAELYALIARLREELNCGILMVSHDLHMVMAGTDHVVCINRHVCCEGKPAEVTGSEAWVQVFGTAVSPLQAPYVHRHDHVHGADGHVCPLPLAQRGETEKTTRGQNAHEAGTTGKETHEKGEE